MPLFLNLQINSVSFFFFLLKLLNLLNIVIFFYLKVFKNFEIIFSSWLIIFTNSSFFFRLSSFRTLFWTRLFLRLFPVLLNTSINRLWLDINFNIHVFHFIQIEFFSTLRLIAIFCEIKWNLTNLNFFTTENYFITLVCAFIFRSLNLFLKLKDLQYWLISKI